MRRDRAIELIKTIEPAIRSLGAAALYIFGSTARDDATPTSDIDIFVDRDPSKHVGLIEFSNLEILLEETLGTEVDLCTRAALHPALRETIEKTAIKVF